jgi:hypothetical protein
VSEYELIQDVVVGTKPKEAKDTEGAALDHTTVSKAVEHGRPDALGAKGALHLQRMAGNAAMGSLVQREAEESPVKDVVGKGGGTTLSDDVRKPMEAKLGADFSGVRVHTDSKAAEAATSVQSKAFTSGNDIVFNAGNYQPHTQEGQHMLAHELTHVVQQRSGPVDGTSRGDGTKVSDPSDSFEREAEATATAVMSDSHAGHDHGAGATASAGVQRDADDDVQTMHDASIQRESEGPEEEDEQVSQMRDESIQRESEGPEEEDEQVSQMRDESIQRDESEEEEGSE